VSLLRRYYEALRLLAVRLAALVVLSAAIPRCAVGSLSRRAARSFTSLEAFGFRPSTSPDVFEETARSPRFL